MNKLSTSKIYKIFGRKKGRKKNNNSILNNSKYLISNFTKKLQDKEIIIDIGFGNGESTIFLSKKYTDKEIIASDVYNDGNIKLIKKIKENNLKNISIFNQNILMLIDQINFSINLSQVWILFPDPWPKKKHHKRRLVNEDFLQKIANMMKKNGKIVIATDSTQYFFSIICSISNLDCLKWINDIPKKWQYSNQNLPETNFYKKALKNKRIPKIIILSKI